MAGRHRKQTATKRNVAAASALSGVLTGVIPGTGFATDRWSAIIECESGGDPAAQNPTSTASGLFQFVNGTWRLYGGSTARAKDAPEAEQYAVADRAFAVEGYRPWESSRACWGSKVSDGTGARHSSGAMAPKHARSEPPRHAKRSTSYTIQSGDTLADIAAAHHTTWRRLFAANRTTITDPNRIYAGVRIDL